MTCTTNILHLFNYYLNQCWPFKWPISKENLHVWPRAVLTHQTKDATSRRPLRYFFSPALPWLQDCLGGKTVFHFFHQNLDSQCICSKSYMAFIHIPCETWGWHRHTHTQVRHIWLGIYAFHFEITILTSKTWETQAGVGLGGGKFLHL